MRQCSHPKDTHNYMWWCHVTVITRNNLRALLALSGGQNLSFTHTLFNWMYILWQSQISNICIVKLELRSNPMTRYFAIQHQVIYSISGDKIEYSTFLRLDVTAPRIPVFWYAYFSTMLDRSLQKHSSVIIRTVNTCYSCGFIVIWNSWVHSQRSVIWYPYLSIYGRLNHVRTLRNNMISVKSVNFIG